MDRSSLQLETPRLLLRLPRQEDFEAWAAFLADVEATRHLGGVQPRPVAWRGLAAMVGAWHLKGFAMFSVVEKDTGQWVGRVGPWQPEGWPGTEVGWSIVRERWGRGYAPEAAAACTAWAFDTLGWSEVIHTIAPGNASSKAVAAKLGSRFIGMGRLPEPSHEKPVEIWGQTRAEWRARKEQSA
ncbi:GNAT family N-acetyltransferase [Pseudoxanthomonas kaohsiungensis]|jgi:RimJ/RimL family protein N-acetyltransferase|uniref:GNAT family N-acetyltransferase n=1 Tax=Pseudoxanthomonas kaohsiungensis TaxID=283923 RepID=A0ABW3LXT5_9GAMM|nr:GNAT family N-acetyltransferase [Pseudoxanthomonas kaohsiungensis]KAF1702392.1 GNAT family N-acetyltransferase [Pseudoxanthomonas kaohsiungensis]